AVCGGAVRQLLGGDERFAERLPYADPAVLLPTGIATTVVQGRTDVDVPQAVAEAYADAAAKAGEVVGLTLLEDVGHFPLIDPTADARAVVAEDSARLAWWGAGHRTARATAGRPPVVPLIPLIPGSYPAGEARGGTRAAPVTA